MSRRRDDREAPGPRAPAARSETVRETLRRALREGPATLQELSGHVRVAEKQLLEHLEHLRRSLAGRGVERLEVEPARCLACGFCFDARKRLSKPSRCPQCKSTRVTPPRFSLGS
ncbi:MAG: transcriptional regulator [Enhygromyxa sp.]